MRAKVTTAFSGRRDHETLPTLIPVGEVITGDLASAAIAAGNATEVGEGSVLPNRPAPAKKAAKQPRVRKQAH